MTTLAVLGSFAGWAILLDRLPWFRERSLVERLRPYVRRPPARRARGVVSAQPMVEVLLPGIEAAGTALSRLVGVETPLSHRLERAGDPTPPEVFRLRQARAALLAGVSAAALAVVVRPGLPLTAAALLAAPLLGSLGVEQRLATAIDRRQQQLRAELPVMVEQLGTLLAAGYSLPGAIARLGARAAGAVADELRTVSMRVHHGLSVDAALAEWSERSDLEPVRRLVHVLSLHADATDLASLVAEEARSIRAEAHRDLLEDVERRSQLVWIPVTVATLLPGLLFLAVPFIDALSKVAGG